MWSTSTVVTSAASEPITLAQAKAQCRIATGDTTFDSQLTMLIAAARAYVENYCGIRLVTQTRLMKCTCFDDFERTPEAPLQSITSVQYIDTDGNAATLSADAYELREEGLAPSIVAAYSALWPSIRIGSRISVTAVAGYATVPADIVAALLLVVSKTFAFSRADMLKRAETVEGIGSVQWGGVVETTAAADIAVTNILEPYRCWPLG